MRAQKVLFVSLEMTREEVYDRLRGSTCSTTPGQRPPTSTPAWPTSTSATRTASAKDLTALANEFAVEADVPHPTSSWSTTSATTPGPRQQPVREVGNAVMQLKAEAKAGRFVIMPSQVNRGAKEGKPIDLDDARDAGTVEETADFLLALFRPDDALTCACLCSRAATAAGDW
jgi:replicative DNA helicase